MSGGKDTVTNSNSPPEWAVPYLKDYYGQAKATSQLPYQPYDGQRVGDMTPYTEAGLNAQAQRAMQGSQEVGQARDQLGATLTGAYMGYRPSGNANAGAFNPLAGVRNENAATMNPYASVMNSAAGASGGDGGFNEQARLYNKFAGSNPYMSGMIDASSQDVLRNYNTAVKPQIESSMARSGSFGNSGLQEMQRNEQSDLQRNLGNLSNQYRFQDYTTQQGLDEARLGRLYGAGQQQVQNRFQSGENSANRQFQAGEGLANRLYGAGSQYAGNLFSSGENLAGRLYGAGSQYTGNQFAAGESQANRMDGAYQNERQRQLAGIGMAPGLANQDYIDAAALTSAGDRFGAQNQALLDTQYGNFQEARDYPNQQLRTLGSAFGANPGNTSTSTGPGSNPWAQGIGAGASLYGLSKMPTGGGK